jgi:hypothetical protein
MAERDSPKEIQPFLPGYFDLLMLDELTLFSVCDSSVARVREGMDVGVFGSDSLERGRNWRVLPLLLVCAVVLGSDRS